MENIIEILKKNVGTKLTTGDAYSGGENIFFTKAEAFKNTADDLGIKTLIFDAQSLYFEWNDHYFRLESPEQIDVFVRDYSKDFQYRDNTQNPFTKEYLAGFSKIPTAEDLFNRKPVMDLEEKVDLEEVVDENTEKSNLRKVLTHPYTYGAIIIAYMVAGNMCN